MKIADLFCGAGGAGMGLHRAGFEVVGFDIESQKNYPFEFHQQDAFTVDLSGFDAVWASPPCQKYGQAKNVTKSEDLAKLVSFNLSTSYKPYIIENVPGAPLRPDVTLCGSMFELRTLRHRWFESNVELICPAHGTHSGRRASDLRTYMTLKDFDYIIVTSGRCPKSDAEIAMGIDWMTVYELTQAVPPAYSEYLGKQLIQYIEQTI